MSVPYVLNVGSSIKAGIVFHSLISPSARPVQYNPDSECRIKAAAVEAAGCQTKVNGVILQIKANSLDCSSCNPIIPRPHVFKAETSGRGGSPPSPSYIHPIKTQRVRVAEKEWGWQGEKVGNSWVLFHMTEEKRQFQMFWLWGNTDIYGMMEDMERWLTEGCVLHKNASWKYNPWHKKWGNRYIWRVFMKLFYIFEMNK